MAFFDDLGAKLSKTGQKTMQKANDLADITKLNMRTGELNKAIQELYAKVGEQYYALHREQPGRSTPPTRSWSRSGRTFSESVRSRCAPAAAMKTPATPASAASAAPPCPSCPVGRRPAARCAPAAAPR